MRLHEIRHVADKEIQGQRPPRWARVIIWAACTTSLICLSFVEGPYNDPLSDAASWVAIGGATIMAVKTLFTLFEPGRRRRPHP